MQVLIRIAIFCLFAGPVFSQNTKEPDSSDILKEFWKMQQQLMQQLRSMSPGGMDGAFQWDTTYSFRMDTLFDGNGMQGGFFFSPFDQDTAFMREFFDMNPFGGGMRPLERFDDDLPPETPGSEESDENSALEDKGDGLLPEERLRQQENGSAKPPVQEKQPAPESKKPKIKTIRI